jgi:hypothetical protein
MKVDGIPLAIGGSHPYYMLIDSKNKPAGGSSAAGFLSELKRLLESGEIDPDSFLHAETIRPEKKKYEYKVPKYDRYVPNELLKRQVAEDYIDLPEIVKQSKNWNAV